MSVTLVLFFALQGAHPRKELPALKALMIRRRCARPIVREIVMADVEDKITEREAFILARDYGLVPVDPLKCERVVGDNNQSSIFFANTSNRVKVYVQYDRELLEPHE